jgi:Raf kinase inhibitor-like YbhB/YbcL family protein
MGLVHDAAKSAGAALKPVRAGDDKLIRHKIAPMPDQIIVTSPAFTEQSRLPVLMTADADGTVSPPVLAWSNLPAESKSIVVVCEDPDAPLPEPFVHWIMYGIPVSAPAIDAQTSSAWGQGKNSKLRLGYLPAAPPPGHGVHHYHFQIFALDTGSDFAPGVGRSALIELVAGHVLAWGELVGTYERS